MSVLLETSAGELVFDLFVEECPIACNNFLKLCKIKYYNNCLFYNIQQNYIAQTGDPTGTGHGGSSIFGIINSDGRLGFMDEIVKTRKLNKVGLVSMATNSENANKSQFFITLRAEDLEHLDGKHSVFAEVAEGFDVLEKLNSLYCDEEGRPYQDVRIRHTYVLDDPFPDPPLLHTHVPPVSPTATRPSAESVKVRVPYEESLTEDTAGRTAEEVEESIRRKEAYSRALVLEMTGDIPDVDVKPPKEVIFVCKLNPVTTDADLELIFSRFGTITQCEIIRDAKTGDSLNYAFIEFESEAACIEAFDKMNNALIDDRRIKVDFSQSVSKLWNKYLLRPRKETKNERLQSHSTVRHAADAPLRAGIQFSAPKPNEIAPGRRDTKYRSDNDYAYRTRERSGEREKPVDVRKMRERSRERERPRERSRERIKGRDKIFTAQKSEKDSFDRGMHRNSQGTKNSY